MNLDFYLDLIIETETSIGIAAYPKADFPPPEEAEDQSVIETMSAPSGEWTWISKGTKPDYNIEHGLNQLEEYRDFDPDAQEAYEKLLDIDGIRILEPGQDKDNSLIESLFLGSAKNS